MSIPLDRLYHYIESVAQDVYGDTIIYRFYPHGSKNIDDLRPLTEPSQPILDRPQIFCNDQEPLNFDLYTDVIATRISKSVLQDGQHWFQHNLRKDLLNIFDSCLIIHSEKNSIDLDLYKNLNFIPVYYWSHALISLDWYRYAKHITKCYNPGSTEFLVYNRDWTGTREYRAKFAELLVKNQLLKYCKTSFCFVNNQSTNYTDYNFHNQIWKPTIKLEDYYTENISKSSYSADFEISDYKETKIEVVLETLFDDVRWHLTEKSLRPIALGHPFILCATPGSLEYLKSYGFKTFDSIFNEEYDQITNAEKRMQAIIQTMSEIAQWTNTQKQKKYKLMQEICMYNKSRFFSDQFFNQVDRELRQNLKQGLEDLINTNTFNVFLQRKQYMEHSTKFQHWRANNTPSEVQKKIEDLYQQILNLKK
jgi:hypothetical protein